MRYQKALEQFDRYFTSDWGAFTQFSEIGDDLFAVRQIRAYMNGNYLRYDRENWCDEFGFLGGSKHTKEYDNHSRKEWVIEDIEKDEFESMWVLALSGPNQPQRYTTSGRKWDILKLIPE